MLASLFRGNSGPKTNQYIDSVTDDAHTRNLLFGQSSNVLSLATSPTSPFASPPIRPGSFDDHGGLELEEKDVRVLLAQDAHGDVDRPLLLFDSRRDTKQPTPRTPIPTNWHNRTASLKNEDLSRHRSSTFSGSQTSWSKAARGVRPQDDPFLNCMFGVKYFKKTDTSTKLHIIPAKNRHRERDSLPRAESKLEQRRRAPLARAHTSGEHPTLSVLDAESKDCLLITRLFQVTLGDGSKVVVEPKATGSAEKPPKLVETKLPQYAVGFVLQLPHSVQSPRSSSAKFVHSLTSAHSFKSIASSFESDLQSSWTFLDAVPASLSSSINLMEEDDRRLDMIVDNWDVVLRTMAFFERKAANVLKEQLESMLKSVEPRDKLPKDKSFQRINQLMVAIHEADYTMSHPALIAASVDVARRIAYALRIPRVVTGLGITLGHWTDEARMLYRVCGGKQQNFFLFNLLTAFLGNHMQWLERLAPEWYRNRFEAKGTRSQELGTLASRTIICAEQKGLARRLVYVLASFLPNHKGISGLSREPDQGRLAFSLSPTGPLSAYPTSCQPSKPYILRPQASKDLTVDKLSCSASSQDSHASTLANKSPRKPLTRRPSNTIQIRNNRIESEVKTGAGTISAIMPESMDTPQAYIHSLRGSYFPESAIIETSDSVATADLSKVLRKASSSHRRTSSVSSRWGSLVSGISEIWSKPSTSDDRRTSSSLSAASPVKAQQRSTSTVMVQPSALQLMVDELDVGDKETKPEAAQSGRNTFASLSRPQPALPRLRVDDKDGVVDVELDLPGFLGATTISSLDQTSQSLRQKSIGFTGDGMDSACSFRSITGQAELASGHKSVNVGGYLRRHHEDFTLHAVRPYDSLVKDVKRAMLLEPTPKEMIDKVFAEGSSHAWICVCTTLIADIRTYTVRRFSLRRQYEVRPSSATGTRSEIVATSSTGAVLLAHAEEITEETVMESDTTLADAIEKILNVSPADGTAASRTHSRNVSLGSSNAPGSTAQPLDTPQPTSIEEGKLEQCDLVIGALQDVVNSVNDDLNNPELTIRATLRPGDTPKQENALREGVKKWMIDVEHTAVW